MRHCYYLQRFKKYLVSQHKLCLTSSKNLSFTNLFGYYQQNGYINVVFFFLDKQTSTRISD